uniref:Uncharacterized protein n=1 Tax=Photinus pyralis TaxID=7054 RepID=A0A1Y1JRY3_PHOPY
MNRILLRLKQTPRISFCGRISKLSNSYYVKSDERAFMETFPEVIQVLMNSPWCLQVPSFADHYKELIKYTVLKERRFRPSIVMEAYRAMESPENFSKEKLHLVTIFAWSIELMQSALITLDDIWDQSPMRGNDIPWYKKPNIGLTGINDGVILYESAFSLIKTYFSSQNVYTALMETLHQLSVGTAIGQYLDWKCKRDSKPTFENFNMQTYRGIARFKTASALVETPFKGIRILTNNLPIPNSSEDVFMELGVACQIDNDILDTYNEKGEVRHQVGSDIREGACTWPAIQVLESGNKEMIRKFKQNYGRPQLECENEIIKIFEEFRIFGKYRTYCQTTRGRLEKRAREMEPSLQRAILAATENVLPISAYI